jgi:hypothetical protein
VEWKKGIPVIIRATGTITKSFRKDLNNIQGKHVVEELHIAHILRKVLMLKYVTFNMGDNTTCSKNCKYRTAATLYTREMWFVAVCNCKNPE